MTTLPEPYSAIRRDYPDIAVAYDMLGAATRAAGPMEDKARQLVKLALAIGAGLEGATHAHARRAVEMGIEAAEIRQVALLAVTTLGFPTAVRAYTWVNDVLESDPGR